MIPLKQHRAFVVLIAFAAILFLSDIWVYKEFVRAESYFALGARSMVERQEWLTPHAPDELQLNKPPLTYWFIGLSYKLFGTSYGSARLPSVVAALLVLIVVYGLGTKLSGVRSGLVSAAILATSYLFLSFARLAMSDMLLTLWVTGAFACFLVTQSEPTQRSQNLVLIGYVALALGVLTKGPAALALVAVPIGLELLARRSRAGFQRLRWLKGLALFLLITVPYFLVVYLRAGSSPLMFFFLSENFQRFTGDVYAGGGRPFWYELAAFFSDFAPWSVLLILAVWIDWRSRKEKAAIDGKRILYLWLLWTVTLFSVASFKRDYYLLPAMPAAALVIGPLFTNTEKLSAFARRVLAVFLVAVSAILIAGALLSLRAAAALSVQGFLRFVPVVIAIVGCAALLLLVFRRRIWQASLVLSATICATVLSLQLSLLPSFVGYLPTAQLAVRVPSGRAIYSSRSASDWASGLSFSIPTSNTVERLIDDVDNQKLATVLAGDPRAVAVVWEREYQVLRERDPALRIIAETETYPRGGLSLNLIRNPQRQKLLLVGH